MRRKTVIYFFIGIVSGLTSGLVVSGINFYLRRQSFIGQMHALPQNTVNSQNAGSVFLPTTPAADLNACKNDVESYCRGVTPGGGRVKQCLLKNKGQLSTACLSALELKITN